LKKTPSGETVDAEQTPTAEDVTQEKSKTKKSSTKKVFIVVNEEDKKVKKVFQKEKKVKGKKSNEDTFTENSSDVEPFETAIQNIKPVTLDNNVEKINEDDNVSIHTDDFRDIPLNIHPDELEEDLLSEISACQS
jgi:hypothetical protein